MKGYPVWPWVHLVKRSVLYSHSMFVYSGLKGLFMLGWGESAGCGVDEGERGGLTTRMASGQGHVCRSLARQALISIL